MPAKTNGHSAKKYVTVVFAFFLYTTRLYLSFLFLFEFNSGLFFLGKFKILFFPFCWQRKRRREHKTLWYNINFAVSRDSYNTNTHIHTNIRMHTGTNKTWVVARSNIQSFSTLCIWGICTDNFCWKTKWMVQLKHVFSSLLTKQSSGGFSFGRCLIVCLLLPSSFHSI